MASYMSIPGINSPLSLSEIESSLKHKAANQEILSKNIENSDTPRYKALEVAEQNDFASFVNSSIELNQTHPHHIQGKRKSQFRIIKQKDAFQVKPNGNNVSLPQQTMKMSKNQIANDTAVEAYKSANELLINALGKNGQ